MGKSPWDPSERGLWIAVAMSGSAGYIADADSGADVAKLADAQPSEGCARKGMEVQLLSAAVSPHFKTPAVLKSAPIAYSSAGWASGTWA